MSGQPKNVWADAVGKIGRSLMGSTRRRTTTRSTTTRRTTSTRSRRTTATRLPRRMIAIPRTSTIIRWAVMTVIAVIALMVMKGKLPADIGGSPEMSRMARTYRQAEKTVERVAGKTGTKKPSTRAKASSRSGIVQDAEPEPVADEEPLFTTFKANRQAQGSGVVKKVLQDDTEGSRHQKFILEDRAGNTLLVTHNIDLAPRIAGLKEGDRVDFCGEFFTNDQGGGVHWTHKDPDRRHVGGWLRHNGRVYE